MMIGIMEILMKDARLVLFSRNERGHPSRTLFVSIGAQKVTANWQKSTILRVIYPSSLVSRHADYYPSQIYNRKAEFYLRLDHKWLLSS